MRTSLRLTAAAATLAALAASAPAAMAAIRYDVEFDNTVRSGGQVFVQDNQVGGGHTVTTNLLRGGSVIASDTRSSGFGFVSVPNKGALLAGDQVQMLVDGGVDLTQGYDGNPTINPDACVGSTKFTGVVTDAGNFSVDVSTPTSTGGGSGASSDSKAVSVSRGSGAFSATVTPALIASDVISASQSFISGQTSISQFRSANPGATCPAPAVTPTPTPTPPAGTGTKPSIAQIFSALQAVIAQAGTKLNGLDITSFVKTGSTSVPLTFLVPGKFHALLVYTTGGSTRSAQAAAKKKTKTITVATGSKTRKTPGKANMPIKLGKAGKKLIRHRSSIRLTLQMTFTPADGTAAQKTTTKVTLRKHAKKSTKKTKTKKTAKRG